MLSEYITKSYFDKAQTVNKDYIDVSLKRTKDYIDNASKNTRDHFDKVLTRALQEIIQHFNDSQGQQNIVLDGLKDKVDKIELVLEDYIQTDKTVITLVHELEDDHKLRLPRTSALLVK